MISSTGFFWLTTPKNVPFVLVGHELTATTFVRDWTRADSHNFCQTCSADSSGVIIRSHHGESTASHPNCAVNRHWAQIVLRLGTTRELWVTNADPAAALQWRVTVWNSRISDLISLRHTTISRSSGSLRFFGVNWGVVKHPPSLCLSGHPQAS